MNEAIRPVVLQKRTEEHHGEGFSLYVNIEASPLDMGPEPGVN